MGKGWDFGNRGELSSDSCCGLTPYAWLRVTRKKRGHLAVKSTKDAVFPM